MDNRCYGNAGKHLGPVHVCLHLCVMLQGVYQQQTCIIKGGADLGDKLPSLGPAYGMLIHEHPHQLWHSYGGVGVIQLK